MNVLVTAPHMDDEVLGCASYLHPGTTVLYVTGRHPQYPAARHEREAVIRAGGFESIRLDVQIHECDGTNHLDCACQARLIDSFEKSLASAKPDLVLVPSASYNQDHRAVYDAMITACRPHDRNHWPKKVMAYEEPETFGSLRQPPAFRPTYFRRLDIARKLELYRLYASQVRGHRNEGDIRAIAHVRGMASGYDYAEAFEVLRWVE